MGSREEIRIAMAKLYIEIDKIAKVMKSWGCDCESVCVRNDNEHIVVLERRRLIAEKLNTLGAEYVKLSMEF